MAKVAGAARNLDESQPSLKAPAKYQRTRGETRYKIFSRKQSKRPTTKEAGTVHKFGGSPEMIRLCFAARTDQVKVAVWDYLL